MLVPSCSLDHNLRVTGDDHQSVPSTGTIAPFPPSNTNECYSSYSVNGFQQPLSNTHLQLPEFSGNIELSSSNTNMNINHKLEVSDISVYQPPVGFILGNSQTNSSFLEVFNTCTDSFQYPTPVNPKNLKETNINTTTILNLTPTNSNSNINTKIPDSRLLVTPISRPISDTRKTENYQSETINKALQLKSQLDYLYANERNLLIDPGFDLQKEAGKQSQLVLPINNGQRAIEAHYGVYQNQAKTTNECSLGMKLNYNTSVNNEPPLELSNMINKKDDSISLKESAYSYPENSIEQSRITAFQNTKMQLQQPVLTNDINGSCQLQRVTAATPQNLGYNYSFSSGRTHDPSKYPPFTLPNYPTISGIKETYLSTVPVSYNFINEVNSTKQFTLYQQIQRNPIIWDKIHSRNKKGVYKCNHCPKTFTKLDQFAKHLDENKVVRPFKCRDRACPWSIIGLNSSGELRRHHRHQHNTSGTQYECKYCSKKFNRSDSAQRHQKLVHENKKSRYNKFQNK